MKEDYKNKAMGVEKITHKKVFNFPSHSISFKAVDLADANKQLKEHLKGRSIKVNKKELSDV